MILEGAGKAPTGDWSDITYGKSGETIPSAGTEGIITIGVQYGKASPRQIKLPILKAKTNQQTVTEISDELKTIIPDIPSQTITVPAGVNTDVTNSVTRAVLNTELKNVANGKLKGSPGDGINPPTGDFSKIYYTGGPLVPSGTVDNVVVHVNSNNAPSATYGPTAQAEVPGLKVAVAQTDQETITSLFNLIDDKDINLPYGKDYKTSDPTDSNTILDILKENNTLFKNDLASDVKGATFDFGDIPIGMEDATPKNITMNLAWKGTTYTYSSDPGLKASVNNTWTQSNPLTTASQSLNNSPRQIGNALYLNSTEGLYKSTDDGKTWEQDGKGYITTPPVTLGNNSYYSISRGGTYERSLVKLRYVANGQSAWSPVNMPGAVDRSTFQAQPARFNAGTATTPDWKYFIMSNDEIGGDWTSNDGINWTKMSGSLPIIVERAPSRVLDSLYSGTYGNGLWESDDKTGGWQTWTKVANKGIPNAAKIRNAPFYFGTAGDNVKPFVYVVNASGGGVAPDGATGVYYQDLTSKDWTKATGIIAGAQFLNTKPVKIGGTIYWQSSNKGLFYSTDEGQTWQQK